MKNLLFALFCITLLACSSDDDSMEEASQNYLPINQENSWTYDWTSSIGQVQNNGTDVTIMSGTANVDGVSFTNWMNVIRVFGFTDNMLVNKIGSLTSYRLPEIDLGFDQTLELDSFVIIDDNSSPGTTLADIEFMQTIDAIPVDQDGITGTITPTVTLFATSTHNRTFPSITLNGGELFEDVYNSIINFEIEVDLLADLSIQGFPITLNHTLIPQQQYANIEGWYVNELGLARSEIVVERLEIDNTVDVPVIGEIDIADFGVDFEDLLDVNEGSSVAELIDFIL